MLFTAQSIILVISGRNTNHLITSNSLFTVPDIIIYQSLFEVDLGGYEVKMNLGRQKFVGYRPCQQAKHVITIKAIIPTNDDVFHPDTTETVDYSFIKPITYLLLFTQTLESRQVNGPKAEKVQDNRSIRLGRINNKRTRQKSGS